MDGDDRKVCETEEVTLEEAVVRVPFMVLAPTSLPWPRDGTFRPRFCIAKPLKPGYSLALSLCYFPAGGIVSVAECAVHPSLHPYRRPDISELEKVERGGRVIHLDPGRGEESDYAYFEQGGTHVEIFGKLERHQLLDFIDSFASVEKKEEWITGASDGFAPPARDMTQEAKSALHRAYREVVRLDVPYVGTEHLLLALVEKEDCGAAEILAGLGCDRDALLAAVRGLIATGSAPKSPVRIAVERGFEEARILGHAALGTQHLLLGLIQEPDRPGGRLLREAGLEASRARQAVIDHHERGGREAR